MRKEKLLYTTGEVARQLNLEQHVLRFWEKQFNQIQPIKCKGRRLYDSTCIENIKQIKYMLHDKGYTIKGAQKELHNNKSPDKVIPESDIIILRNLLEEIRGWLTNQINK